MCTILNLRRSRPLLSSLTILNQTQKNLHSCQPIWEIHSLINYVQICENFFFRNTMKSCLKMEMLYIRIYHRIIMSTGSFLLKFHLTKKPCCSLYSKTNLKNQKYYFLNILLFNNDPNRGFAFRKNNYQFIASVSFFIFLKRNILKFFVR